MLHLDKRGHATSCDVLQLLLSALSQQDAHSAASVCKAWLTIVERHLHALTLHSTTPLPRIAARFANLERLSLHNVRPSQADLGCIAQLRYLRTLSFRGPVRASAFDLVGTLQE